MKRALVALDPTACEGINFDHFVDTIGFFQRKEVIPSTSLVSIFHRGLTPYPLEIYDSQKRSLMEKAESEVLNAARGRFKFDSFQLLESANSSFESHARMLSRLGRKIGADLLVIGSSDRSRISHWFLGSFSETAALTAGNSVLVVKPASGTKFSIRPKFVLCVDPHFPPSDRAIRWIGDLAKPPKARILLLHVLPARFSWLERIHETQARAEAERFLFSLEEKFVSRGIRAVARIKTEGKSIAHTITDFAQEEEAWITMTYAAKKPPARRLLLGSHARRVLAISERPFLSVRID